MYGFPDFPRNYLDFPVKTFFQSQLKLQSSPQQCFTISLLFLLLQFLTYLFCSFDSDSKNVLDSLK